MMPKRRAVVIGAGLSGSILSTLLRDQFEVTVIEQGRRPRPLFHDIECATGGVTSSINRGEGLGGTTNYWHNALVEMTDADLSKAGVPQGALAPYYSRAWSFFLSDAERRECDRIGEENRKAIENGVRTVAHMVTPLSRANVWNLAHERYPGSTIRLIYAKATKIAAAAANCPVQVTVESNGSSENIEADIVVVCAGGLATPGLLARSVGIDNGRCEGYHDHPMAYVAKVRLRQDSPLKTVSCKITDSFDVRAGIVYETEDTKTVIFIRPALNLKLNSIRGPARFILSDFRNSLSSIKIKNILQLLSNPEAVWEGILFKTKAGFIGDYYSILLFGEQTPVPTRGVTVSTGRPPSLEWHITERELRSYRKALEHFLADFSSDILETKVLPVEEWEFRTGAHHSGTAAKFLSESDEFGLNFFKVASMSNVYVCDGSILRAAGIANSALTLMALAHRLADLLELGETRDQRPLGNA